MMFCVSEAETRQKLLRTVKKEVGVFSSAVIVSEKQTYRTKGVLRIVPNANEWIQLESHFYSFTFCL